MVGVIDPYPWQQVRLDAVAGTEWTVGLELQGEQEVRVLEDDRATLEQLGLKGEQEGLERLGQRAVPGQRELWEELEVLALQGEQVSDGVITLINPEDQYWATFRYIVVALLLGMPWTMFG